MPLLSLALLALSAALLGRDSAPHDLARVERRLYVMGTVLRAEAEGPGTPATSAALEDAIADVERLGRVLSTWDDDTPMARLNGAPLSVPTAADVELLGLLTEAEAWAVRTGRAFDPTLGPLVDAWDLRGIGREPAEDRLREARAAVGSHAVDMDVDEGTFVRRASGAWIDTGGFGKGAALRSAADKLSASDVHRALLDLGGQVLAFAREGHEAWTVAVAHPLHRDVPFVTLSVAGVSVATSGTSERGAHILDPRTGRPAPAWGSVTVVSPDPLVADILSTALYVMGPEAGPAWAQSLPDVGVLFLVVDDGGIQTLHNRAMTAWLVERP